MAALKIFFGRKKLLDAKSIDPLVPLAITFQKSGWIEVKLSDAQRTDLTNTDVQSTKLTLNLNVNPLLFLKTFTHTLTILTLTCS